MSNWTLVFLITGMCASICNTVTSDTRYVEGPSTTDVYLRYVMNYTSWGSDTCYRPIELCPVFPEECPCCIFEIPPTTDRTVGISRILGYHVIIASIFGITFLITRDRRLTRSKNKKRKYAKRNYTSPSSKTNKHKRKRLKKVTSQLMAAVRRSLFGDQTARDPSKFRQKHKWSQTAGALVKPGDKYTPQHLEQLGVKFREERNQLYKRGFRMIHKYKRKSATTVEQLTCTARAIQNCREARDHERRMLGITEAYVRASRRKVEALRNYNASTLQEYLELYHHYLPCTKGYLDNLMYPCKVSHSMGTGDWQEYKGGNSEYSIASIMKNTYLNDNGQYLY